MNQLKSLADIKRRLVIGAEVTLFKHDWYPDGILVGVPRVVEQAQSNGVKFEGGSWSFYPKAREVKFEGGLKYSWPLDDKGARMYYEITKEVE